MFTDWLCSCPPAVSKATRALTSASSFQQTLLLSARLSRRSHHIVPSPPATPYVPRTSQAHIRITHHIRTHVPSPLAPQPWLQRTAPQPLPPLALSLLSPSANSACSSVRSPTAAKTTSRSTTTNLPKCLGSRTLPAPGPLGRESGRRSRRLLGRCRRLLVITEIDGRKTNGILSFPRNQELLGTFD